MSKIIFTSQASFKPVALKEIRNLLPNSELVEWLGDGVGLINTDLDKPELLNKIVENSPIFVRHICPVDSVIDLKGDFSDLKKIEEAAKELGQQLNADKPYSVQIRILENAIKLDYKKFEIIDSISSEIPSTCKLNVKNPDQVISVVISKDKLYIGLSTVEQNLSKWAGGEVRIAKEKGHLCRAEFKLIEAIEESNLDLGQYRTAADLGAAPGGWTRVLLKEGLNVTAIDPALLDRTVTLHPKVRHFKGTSQEFLEKKGSKSIFDVIVDDMKINPNYTADIIIDFLPCLAKNGLAIVTLKLPSSGALSITKSITEKFSEYFDIIRVRQLYHNRSEVTIVMRKK